MPTKSGSRTITRDPNWLGPAIPPGEMLLEEFLKPQGIGQVEAARRLGISLNRLTRLFWASAPSRRTLPSGSPACSRCLRSSGFGCRLIGTCIERWCVRRARPLEPPTRASLATVAMSASAVTAAEPIAD